jgi:hypothetical protein
MILILTEHRDSHADHVSSLLRQRKAPLLRFDPADFPRLSTLSITFSSTGLERQLLTVAGVEIDLAAIEAVWYRRPGPPTPHDEIRDDVARRYVAMESSMVLRDLWASLDCPWLPGRPLVVQRAQQKGLQLRIAGELGFELPPTLMTNSPDELLEFYRSYSGMVVSKLAATAFPSTLGLGMVRFTELVTTRDVAHFQTIAQCPMIFQAYIPKRIELRITVVGERAFAAEIHSQTTNHTRYDWRRYDRTRTPHLPHALPIEVEQRCVKLVKQLGLCYGAIDMIVTPDGRYVFIEINPNGQYLWIEEQTGLMISDAICDLLIERVPREALALEHPPDWRAP